MTFTAPSEDPEPAAERHADVQQLHLRRAERERRVYLGVHFQWDGDHGFQSGSAAGEYVYDHVLTPIGS